jgi:hypothetical protein
LFELDPTPWQKVDEENAGLEYPARTVGLLFPDPDEIKGELGSQYRLGATSLEGLFSSIIRRPMGMMSLGRLVTKETWYTQRWLEVKNSSKAWHGSTDTSLPALLKYEMMAAWSGKRGRRICMNPVF